MPSGLTDIIGKDATFNQYVWRVARQFGALIMMRDDSADAPISLEVTPSDYHEKELANAKVEYASLQKLTAKQISAKCKAEYNKSVKNWNKSCKEKVALRKKYEAMLEKCIAFVAPTPDHENLKKMMIDQINESIKWDCTPYPEFKPKQHTNSEWLKIRVDSALRDINYHTEGVAEEKTRCKGREDWLKALNAVVPVEIFKY